MYNNVDNVDNSHKSLKYRHLEGDKNVQKLFYVIGYHLNIEQFGVLSYDKERQERITPVLKNQ